MSQSSLPEIAWLAYECDPGGQYLHLSKVFEEKSEADKCAAEQNVKLKYECIMYSVCPIYFAPDDRWAYKRLVDSYKRVFDELSELKKGSS